MAFHNAHAPDANGDYLVRVSAQCRLSASRVTQGYGCFAVGCAWILLRETRRVAFEGSDVGDKKLTIKRWAIQVLGAVSGVWLPLFSSRKRARPSNVEFEFDESIEITKFASSTA